MNLTRRDAVTDDGSFAQKQHFVLDELAKLLGAAAGVLFTRETPSKDISTGQVAVGAVQPALVVPADFTRRSLLVQNIGAVTVLVGPRGVTAATGKQLGAGAAMTINTVAPVYAITAAGAGSVDFLAETGTHR